MSNDKAIKEIQFVLEQFNDAYAKQDADKIDEFMKKFYTTSDESIIIGTAYKEWMYGTKGAKEIPVGPVDQTGRSPPWQSVGMRSADFIREGRGFKFPLAHQFSITCKINQDNY